MRSNMDGTEPGPGEPWWPPERHRMGALKQGFPGHLFSRRQEQGRSGHRGRAHSAAPGGCAAPFLRPWPAVPRTGSTTLLGRGAHRTAAGPA